MPTHPLTKGPKTVEVARYRVVVVIALDDRLEPFAGSRHGVVPAREEMLLNLPQLRSQALTDRCALHRETPVSVLPADVREAQKVERTTSRSRSAGMVFRPK